ncbi:hypothetical protein J4Q44_G00100980 [Coregonus suidteri]|uniref:Uncharacterized protein n=1 Tax=Coregonus suidteri TaxID=861788 RepID=A0AAN8M0L2_9TELE
MILVELWKQKVFPVLCQLQDFNPKSTFPMYMIHHEATIINLLETIMFHKDSCEAADDSVLDMVDYCHRKLTLPASRASRDDTPTQDRLSHTESGDSSSVQYLQGQNAALEFEISLKALSVLRYITDHTDRRDREEDCQRKYDFNNFNKNHLLKLQGFLTEVLIDQLLNLVELQRFLSHLIVTDPAPPKKDLILEQIPEM